MGNPRICRIAVAIKGMDDFCAATGSLLGIDYVDANFGVPFDGFKVMFGEHGFEPIEILSDQIDFASDGSLIEVAIDVDDAEATKLRLAAGGYVPAVTNHLPEPDAYEYLFPRTFHGLPLMVCTAGDNETQMRRKGPFTPLYDLVAPKIGGVTLVVNDVEAAAADFTRYFDMSFVEVDPAGLARRALTGAHRIRLLEDPSTALDGVEYPLASIDFVLADVEEARRRFVAAGYAVRLEQRFASGGTGYFFGPTVQGIPLSIHSIEADAELYGC